MPGPEPPDVPTTRSLKRKSLSRDDQDDLEELDRIFKRTKTVVPRNPYILSTPSLDAYRYHSQQEAHAWMLGHLWKHNEEHMQYRTYLYREPCQDCFELEAGEDDEPERERERPRSQASQASSTANQGPKKKISLSAYKNKQANGVITPTPGSKLASPSLPPTKPPTAHTNGVKQVGKQSSPTQKPPETKLQKQYVSAIVRRGRTNTTQTFNRRPPQAQSRQRKPKQCSTPATSTTSSHRRKTH
jgi:hypothetical protein